MNPQVLTVSCAVDELQLAICDYTLGKWGTDRPAHPAVVQRFGGDVIMPLRLHEVESRHASDSDYEELSDWVRQYAGLAVFDVVRPLILDLAKRVGVPYDDEVWVPPSLWKQIYAEPGEDIGYRAVSVLISEGDQCLNHSIYYRDHKHSDRFCEELDALLSRFELWLEPIDQCRFAIYPTEVDIPWWGALDAVEEQVLVTFKPQMWVRNWAITVDPPDGQETQWRVPASAVRGIRPATDEADELRMHPAAPAWVRLWPGPFEIIWEVE